MSRWRDFIKERTNALLQDDSAYAYPDGYETEDATQATVQTAQAATANAQIVVLDHITREDATRIADYIGGSKMVVLDLSETPREDQQRILDFISGYMYSEQGKLSRINSYAYIAVPNYVDLYGAAEEDDSLFSQLTNAFGGQASDSTQAPT